MKTKLTALLVIQVCLFQVTYSQKLHFQQYSILEGLPHSTVYSVLQDSRGFLWVGTEGGGLARTDGVSFEVFNNTNGLSGNVVRALHEDRMNRIWIGTDRGLNVYDGNRLEAFEIDQKLNNTNILAISEDTTGNILVGTRDEGLFILNFDNDTTIINLSMTDGLITPLVLDIEVANDNRFWLSMAGGINVVSMSSNQPEIIQLMEGIHIPGDIITCSAKDHLGNIWFGSRERGVFHILDGSDLPTQSAIVPEFLKFLSNETIWDLYWTDTSTCWIATERLGLIRISHNRVKETITRENGLPTNQIYRVHQDDNEGVWLATLGNGILRYGGDLFTKYDLNPNRIGIEVFGIVEEEPGLMLAATDEGLYRIDMRQAASIISTRSVTSGIPYGSSITSIAKNQSGEIWLGTSQGLYTYTKNSASFSDYNGDLSSKRIKALKVDHLNRLWVGTDNGYNLCADGEVYFMNEETGLINNEVQAIIEDQENNIWIGTLGGLVRVSDVYRDFNEEEGLTSLQIHSLAEDARGNIWIGTFGGGIFILENGTDRIRIKQVPGSEKVSSRNIYSLIWQDEFTLLAGTESGIDKITVSQDSICHVAHFDSGDGFCEGSNKLNAVARSSDFTFWFGTSNSLVAYNPAGSKEIATVPVSYIDNLRLNFQDQDWSKDFQTSRWFELPLNLVLPHHQNHLTFDYTAIHFDNPNDLQFSYFLKGQSKSWSPYSTERSVTLQGLAPREYIFRLKAMTKFGVESEETTFSFRIKPPFWFTAWFISSSVLALILLVLLTIRLRVRQLQREKVRLERIVELRTWEITQQKEQIEEQRDVVVSQQKEITDSIRYAKQIQTAVLPEEQLLRDCFKDYFIILLPQQIVSGDFYWMGQKQDHLVFTASDCTGHGVPGAFMSMLGVSFLNKIVHEDGVVMPAEILNALRNNILNVFHHTRESDEVNSEADEGSRDGMDVALCSYDIKQHKLYYSGAMNPLYQIRKNGDEYQLLEHTPDKMPVANYSIMDPFKQKEIQLHEGDTLYIFSDGYSDQFGGVKGKKFMKKQFKKMLLSNQDKSMAEQKKAFQDNLQEWMKHPGEKGKAYTQTDDILIIGVKV